MGTVLSIFLGQKGNFALNAFFLSFFLYLFIEVIKCIRLFLGESQQVDAELWPQAVSSAIPCIIEMMDDVMVASDKRAGTSCMTFSMGKMASLFTLHYILT